MLTLVSPERDPHAHLALEDYLLDHPPGEETLLLFYRNRPSVVLGKNQNPWRECRTDLLSERGLLLARRISGGGTVYHDEGNLNYSLIVPRTSYQRDGIFALVLAGLADLGFHARRTAGHGLFLQDGGKFSGSAFCFRGTSALHHGTLLLDANLTGLKEVLSGSIPQLQTRAIASVPAPVVNLGDVHPGLRAEDLIGALTASLGAGARPVPWSPPPERELASYVARQRDPAWQWGHSPAFGVEIPGWGHLWVERARVVEARCTLAEGGYWRGRAFSWASLYEALRLEDESLRAWLAQHRF